MTSLSRRFRISLSEAHYQRLEHLAAWSGNQVAREASLLLVAAIRMAERRTDTLFGDTVTGQAMVHVASVGPSEEE